MKQIVFTANPKLQIYLSIIQLYIFSSVTLIFQYTVYILQIYNASHICCCNFSTIHKRSANHFVFPVSAYALTCRY